MTMRFFGDDSGATVDAVVHHTESSFSFLGYIWWSLYPSTLGQAIASAFGHLASAVTPVFNWLLDVFHLQRNYYDRFVHFDAGITTAILFREILLRKTPMKGKWVMALAVCGCLTFAAFIELGEFITCTMAGISAEEGLGEQGDRWDTHWDLLVTLIGGVLSFFIFGRYHQIN